MRDIMLWANAVFIFGAMVLHNSYGIISLFQMAMIIMFTTYITNEIGQVLESKGDVKR